MDFKTEIDSWSLDFQNGIVRIIQVDFRLSLFISDNKDELKLHIGTPCRLTENDVVVTIDPENKPSICPTLSLFGQGIKTIFIEKSGRLDAKFEGGYSLEIYPNDSYEAWEIGCSIGFSMVCAPGGKVSLFQK